MRSAMIRLLRPLAIVVFLLPLAPQPVAAMDQGEKRLFDLIKDKPSLRAKLPKHARLTGLAFRGFLRTTDLRFSALPSQVPIVPELFSPQTLQNCTGQAATYAVQINGATTNTASFAVTHGWKIGASTTFEAKWPVAGAEWTISAEYSGSTTSTSAKSKGLGWSATATVPVLPGKQQPVRLVVNQQKLDGIPFELDLTATGPARISYRVEPQWVAASGGRVPANAISGGTEISPTSGERRTLWICRAHYAGGVHPGKVVAGNCNISYGGKEYERSSYEVLTGERQLFSWRKASGGETDTEHGVLGGEEPARKLWICRADYEGGTHPGKLVIHDCMFGYGGKEIESGSYELLLYDADGKAERTLDVNLEDYLTPEDLSFTVGGRFDGLAAEDGNIQILPTRDASCTPSTTIQPLATRETSSRRGIEALHSVTAKSAETAAPPAASEQPVLLLALAGPGEEPGPLIPLDMRMLRPETPDMFGVDVAMVQRALAERGYRLAIDGFYGPRTEHLVRLFQGASGLQIDGWVGPRTAAALGLASTRAD